MLFLARLDLGERQLRDRVLRGGGERPLGHRSRLVDLVFTFKKMGVTRQRLRMTRIGRDRLFKMAPRALPVVASGERGGEIIMRLGEIGRRTDRALKVIAGAGEIAELLVKNADHVEEGRLVGVFSERDVLIRLNTRAPELADRPVSEFMTRGPQSLKEDARLVFAVHQMDLGGYRHLPILNCEGELQGVISVRDLLRYLTEKITASGCPQP